MHRASTPNAPCLGRTVAIHNSALHACHHHHVPKIGALIEHYVMGQ
jgi:hypothetical protein